MANQPKKYKKFVATAATATLVASAIVPVASAASLTDIAGNTHEEAIKALVDAKVINGYADGTFKPNQTLTRSDVVKLLGKYLVSQGHSIPTDAVTNPRFNDLTSKSNKELLEYAAVVADAGVFAGSNGKLLAADQITRENMAIVLVRMINTLKDVSLEEFVGSQNFNGDVKDLNVAKAEARTAIQVLDFYDITNPSVANFNPKGNTTRGQFATFLHKTINADFSGAAATTGTVKAINATTVEVTFGEDVADIKALDFAINGLEVSNAVVKQTDKKTVVLTTSPQTAGVEYTVSVNGNEFGKFTGISAVIPTKVDLVSTSVQGKLGQQVTVQAKVTVAAGQSAAGIPVTLNATSNNPTLNAPQVVEATTDANGVATYTYTRYAAGNDTVVAYATGDRSKFSTGYVFWGVDTILAVTEVTEGATINNGANKTYKIVYKDPTTGTPVSNKTFNVSVLENINITADKLQNVQVNGVTVKQLTNGTAPLAAQITTDSKGEATFTVSGVNTAEITPVVFEANNTTLVTDNKYDASDLQAHAAKVKFSATQADYKIEVTRDGGEVAAIGYENGREYNVVVKDKNGNVAKNEVVNVAFNEHLDRVISTNTDSYFVEFDAAGNRIYDNTLKQITITTNDKGEASFIIANDAASTYATPVAWIDINSAYVNKQGNLDEGEPKTVAAISYFEEEYLDGAALKVKNANGRYTTAAADLKGDKAAEFKVDLVNQSGEATSIGALDDVTYTIYNTGSSVLYIGAPGLTTVADEDKISPNRSKTVKLSGSQVLEVSSFEGKSGSVRVVATGKATHETKAFNFIAKEATAKFTAVGAVTNLEKGRIVSFNTNNKTLTIAEKDAIKYAGVTGKTFNYRDEDNRPVSVTNFEKALQDAAAGSTALEVTYEVKDDVITFYLKALGAGAGAPPVDSVAEAAADREAVEEVVEAIDALDDDSTNANIITAYNAYNALSATQKASVSATVVTKLETAIETAITEITSATGFPTADDANDYTASSWTPFATAWALPQSNLSEKAIALTQFNALNVTSLVEAVAVAFDGTTLTLTFTSAVDGSAIDPTAVGTAAYTGLTDVTAVAVAQGTSPNENVVTVTLTGTPSSNGIVVVPVTVGGIQKNITLTYTSSTTTWTADTTVIR